MALPNYFNHHFHTLKVGMVNAIVGSSNLKTGCGKSYTAMRIGELVDPDFSIKNVVYTPKDFLNVMDTVEENGKPGQVVVVDEGEITAPAALWYSFTNKAIAYNLATFRYLRSMAIFVSPSFSWLDKKVRLLTSHLMFSEKTCGPGHKLKVNLRTYRINTDMFGEKIYFSKIQMYDGKNKRIVSFKKFNVGLISAGLAEEYEKLSREYKKSMRKGLIKEMERFEKYQEGGEKKKDLEEIAKDVLNVKILVESLKSKGKVTQKMVKHCLGDKHNLSYNEAGIVATLANTMWRGKTDD